MFTNADRIIIKVPITNFYGNCRNEWFHSEYPVDSKRKWLLSEFLKKEIDIIKNAEVYSPAII